MSGSNISQNSGLASDKTTPANAGVGEDKAKAFDAQGAIGKQFTGESTTAVVVLNAVDNFIDQGAIGGTAHKVGGPLDKEGAIGKQFTEQGSIGGIVQNALGGSKGASN